MSIWDRAKAKVEELVGRAEEEAALRDEAARRDPDDGAAPVR